MTVSCLFHDYSDYECSSETLIAVYLSHSDAETGLLEYVARGERLYAENQEFEGRYRECHQRNRTPIKVKKGIEKALAERREQYAAEIQKIADDQKAWRMKEFGQDWSDIPDTDINNYHIDEVEIGVIRK